MILLRDIGISLVVASFAIAVGLVTGSLSLAIVVYGLTTLGVGACLGEVSAATVGGFCGLALLLDDRSADPVAAVTLACGLAALGLATARVFSGVARARAQLEWQTDVAAVLTTQLREHLAMPRRILASSDPLVGDPSASGESPESVGPTTTTAEAPAPASTTEHASTAVGPAAVASMAAASTEGPSREEPATDGRTKESGDSKVEDSTLAEGGSASSSLDGVSEILAAVASISASLIEPRIIETTLSAVNATVSAGRATFHLHDRKTDRVMPGKTIVRGASTVEEEEQDPSTYEPLLRLTARKREAQVRKGATGAVGEVFDQVCANGATCPDAVLPVFDRAMLAGFLVVVDPEGDAAIESLQILASACGLAMSSARLSARCENQSKVDSLTGVLTSDAIRDVVERQAAKGPMAVLLLAADHLRKVNELYGRRAGDRTLVEFARLVVREVGNEGVVGRYGGASMLVALPGSRSESAVGLAERLLRRIRKSVVAGPEGLAESLTACAGIAAILGGTPDVVLQGAERALNIAQRSGVNRIYVDGTPAPEGARA